MKNLNINDIEDELKRLGIETMNVHLQELMKVLGIELKAPVDPNQLTIKFTLPG